MFYKLEAFTYEGCPVIGNLDTETPYKEKEFFFTTLAEAEAEIGKQIKSGERYLYFLWFFRITCLPRAWTWRGLVWFGMRGPLGPG